MSMSRTMVARTMINLVIAAALILGMAAPSAVATTTSPTASTSTGACATKSLSSARTKLLASLAKENLGLIAQQVDYSAQRLTAQKLLGQSAAGSQQALMLTAKITILTARISAAVTSETSVASDVSALVVCSKKEFATVKVHGTWRGLITQRALVTAELSVARSDLTFQNAALALEKKAKNTKAEKATKKLIASDKSQIKTDKAELKGLAKKIKAL